MWIQRLIPIAVLAVLSPKIYDRFDALKRVVIDSAPDKLWHTSAYQFEVKFKNIVRNCEDVDIVEDEALAILSCDPGRDIWNTVMGKFTNPKAIGKNLFVYRYDEEDAVPIELVLHNFDRDEFHPLGITYVASTSRLYVINHTSDGSTVEIFKLSLASKTATFVKTLKHDLIKNPNSLIPISDHEFYITNDHYFTKRLNPWLAAIETYLGLPIAPVVYANLETNAVESVAKLPFANGITMMNDSMLAIASCTYPGIYFYSLDPKDPRKLTFVSRHKTPYTPDNLHTDADGILLIAGHPHLPSLEDVTSHNDRCDFNSGDETHIESCRPRAPGWVAEWGVDGRGKTLYVGDKYGTSTSLVRDNKKRIGIVTGLYERGIQVLKY